MHDHFAFAREPAAYPSPSGSARSKALNIPLIIQQQQLLGGSGIAGVATALASIGTRVLSLDLIDPLWRPTSAAAQSQCTLQVGSTVRARHHGRRFRGHDGSQQGARGAPGPFVPVDRHQMCRSTRLDRGAAVAKPNCRGGAGVLPADGSQSVRLLQSSWAS